VILSAFLMGFETALTVENCSIAGIYVGGSNTTTCSRAEPSLQSREDVDDGCVLDSGVSLHENIYNRKTWCLIVRSHTLLTRKSLHEIHPDPTDLAHPKDWVFGSIENLLLFFM
jgi:hypothetical protein